MRKENHVLVSEPLIVKHFAQHFNSNIQGGKKCIGVSKRPNQC